MSLKHIILLALVVFIVIIAVLNWLLCIALSRSERRREKRQDSEDFGQEELSESFMEEEKTEKSED